MPSSFYSPTAQPQHAVLPKKATQLSTKPAARIQYLYSILMLSTYVQYLGFILRVSLNSQTLLLARATLRACKTILISKA